LHWVLGDGSVVAWGDADFIIEDKLHRGDMASHWRVFRSFDQLH
jgi:hypothetical protein